MNTYKLSQKQNKKQKRCWQAESDTNLAITIPHSILLLLNIICAVFIIRILYSKMRFRNLSKEKIKKYR